MHDVIVVGAGPAGLYTALLVAEEGLDVLVLEEHAEVGAPTHCTGIVSAETYDLYKIPDDIVLHRPSRCIVFGPGGGSVEFHNPGEEIAVLDRAGLDRSLALSAAEAGVSVLTGTRASDVQIRPAFGEVATTDGQRLRTRVVVLACGVGYRFNRALGFQLPAAVLHAAQIEIEAEPADALEIHLGRRVAPEGFAWLVPLRRSEQPRLKAGVLLRGDACRHLNGFLDRPEIRRRLREAPGTPIRRLAPVGPTRRTYGDRVVAVGDAAGLTKPVTGGGIFFSLLSARLAAETLVDAFGADDLGARRLSRYERRWRERLLPEIRAGGWFRRLLANLADRELDTFVAALRSADVQSLIEKTAKFNWHRSVIRAILAQPGVKSILFRSLFR